MAAANAEMLEAQIAELEEALANVQRDYDDVFGQLLRRHGDVRRLEAALKKIADGANATLHPSVVRRIAREALRGDKTTTREQELTELVALLVAGFRAAWQGDQHWLDWRNNDDTPDPDDLIERADNALNQEDPE